MLTWQRGDLALHATFTDVGLICWSGNDLAVRVTKSVS